MTDTLPAVQVAINPMTIYQQAVESNADPARLSQIMDLVERFEKNQADKAYGEALAAFQAECPQIKKDKGVSMGGRHAYNFASLDTIMRIIQPILSRHGLSVQFSAGITEGGAVDVKCMVRCGSHTQTTEASIPIPDMKVNSAQRAGAAISYAKRYALCAALNIVVTDEDIDAGIPEDGLIEDQVIKLKEIAESISDGRMAGFFKMMGVDLGDWSTIPASRFNDAKRDLTRVADLVRKEK